MSFESLRKPPKTAIHLWEFLLNLLLDEKSGHMICWTNREAGEFKLKNQEEVARRWGNLKHRPGMNYDKLSRALRYYYQKDIIKKVNGQRLAYKFVKPPLAKESSSLVEIPAKVASPAVEETPKADVSAKEHEDLSAIPCMRSNSLTLPQATLASSSMGFRIIQAPLVSSSHMTYPVSIYPYVVPYVIPACRQLSGQIGIIKS